MAQCPLYIRLYIYTGEYVEIWIPRMVRSKGPGQKGRRALFTERSNPLTADTVSTATDRVYTRSLWAYSIKCANSQDSFRPGGGGEVFSLFSPLIFKEDEDQTRPIFAKHRFNLISSTLFFFFFFFFFGNDCSHFLGVFSSKIIRSFRWLVSAFFYGVNVSI